MTGFENLEVWKRGCRLVAAIYNAFTGCKDYGYKDQVTRAALSIPSNIAEGAERKSYREFIRFLYIAKGSAGELRTQLYIAPVIGLISQEVSRKLVSETKEVSMMLQGLIESIEKNQ